MVLFKEDLVPSSKSMSIDGNLKRRTACPGRSGSWGQVRGTQAVGIKERSQEGDEKISNDCGSLILLALVMIFSGVSCRGVKLRIHEWILPPALAQTWHVSWSTIYSSIFFVFNHFRPFSSR